MKVTFQVDDDLYSKFLDKVIEDETSIKKVLVKAIEDYVKGTPAANYPNYTNQADVLITELALQMIERQLATFKTNPQYQLSDYGVINDLCLDLLPLINSPQCRLLEQDFHQDDALTIINNRLYPI